MKARTTLVGVCATLFISTFSSVTFAQVSQVLDRGDIAWTDSIDWLNPANYPSFPTVYNTDTVYSTNGVAVNVAQSAFGSNFGVIRNDSDFRVTNFPEGDNYYSTNIATNDFNPVTFSDFDGVGICSFGIQIAPATTGPFNAIIEAFNDADISIGSFQVSGSDSDPNAAFLGLQSTDPISYVSIGLLSEATGNYAAYFVLNKADFNACVTEPGVPVLSCDGFAAPMANFPVTAKKNRAFPLKMELFDADGFEQTDVELVAAPVVTVEYTPEVGDAIIDISDDIVSVGQGSDGNQFEFTDEGIWQFNLKSKGLASGTYDVTVSSGDASEYVIDGEANCHTTFIIN